MNFEIMHMPLKEKTVDQLIRETWLSIAKYYNQVAGQYGGSMSIGFTLLNIDPVEGTPSTTLPLKMGMKMTSLSRTLKRMEEMGLIYKEKNAVDARSVIIKLTGLGLDMRNKSKEAVLHFNDLILKQLGREKIEMLRDALEQINTLCQQQDTKTNLKNNK
jgi:DNA-binding MarR family transcriptional regulator